MFVTQQNNICADGLMQCSVKATDILIIMSVAVTEHCINPSMNGCHTTQQSANGCHCYKLTNNASIHLLIYGCHRMSHHLLKTAMQQCFDLWMTVTPCHWLLRSNKRLATWQGFSSRSDNSSVFCMSTVIEVILNPK